MIKIDELQKIVKLVLLTGYIKNVKPLSLMLIADAGEGKTEIISHYKSRRICYMTDISYMGFLKQLKENKSLKHLIIPDFIKITKKKRATSDNLISILNAYVEEGIGRISLYNFEEDFKGRTGGIIVATTKASYGQKRSDWEAIGFLSRMILCSYSYKDETIKEILKFINSEEYLKFKQEKLQGFKDCEIKTNKDLNEKLNIIANKKFRSLKHLQALCKANALLRGVKIVSDVDIREIINLSKFINLNYTKI